MDLLDIARGPVLCDSKVHLLIHLPYNACMAAGSVLTEQPLFS